MKHTKTIEALKHFIQNRRWLLIATTSVARTVQKIRYLLRRDRRFKQHFYAGPLIDGLRGHTSASDISDHLSTLFFLTLMQQPRLIVELGTRGGESTRALLAAASVVNARMLSLDINECGGIELTHRDRWSFVKCDDVTFGLTGLDEWCRQEGLEPKVDVLFIDTSHKYEHTKRELAAWMPRLSEGGLVMLHDTNMGQGAYTRLDGSTGLGWDNQRGVIRALEEWLGCHYQENRYFADYIKGFALFHYPNCDGLTVLKRITDRPSR
ncbi:MAG: class I SAM-dependent methyltransferase [Kiritimatiellia bacterium]